MERSFGKITDELGLELQLTDRHSFTKASIAKCGPAGSETKHLFLPRCRFTWAELTSSKTSRPVSRKVLAWWCDLGRKSEPSACVLDPLSVSAANDWTARNDEFAIRLFQLKTNFCRPLHNQGRNKNDVTQRDRLSVQRCLDRRTCEFQETRARQSRHA